MKRTLLFCLSVFATGLVANAMPAFEEPANSKGLSLLNNLDLPRAPQLASESVVSVPSVKFGPQNPWLL